MTRRDLHICRQAVLTAYHGHRVACSREQYPQVREGLVKAVQFLVTEGDEETADRIMAEVMRLDGIHRKAEPVIPPDAHEVGRGRRVET